MAAQPSPRSVRSWAALAQALIAAPLRWVVAEPDDRRRVRRYANAATTPRGRRSAEAPPREGVRYFVPNLRFYGLLALVVGIGLGGLTGGGLGLVLATTLNGSAAPAPNTAPARPLLQASVGQAVELDGLKLAVVATEGSPATAAGQAHIQITLAYVRGTVQARPGLWTPEGAWSVSAADFGIVTDTATRPLTALRDATGATVSWLAANDAAGWVTLTAQVPCGTRAQLAYDPAPFAGGARVMFVLPIAPCASS